jgi:pimeloyl-ACP methyl ester carboxylesterase
MPVIFVHGVPDTERVWRKVIARIERRDVVALRLPGFGCPVPPGFEATKEAYAGWPVEQIASHGQPVDLVGHDWGAILALRAASLRPDCVRSWATGGAPLDPDYVWHQAAQAWQTSWRASRAGAWCCGARGIPMPGWTSAAASPSAPASASSRSRIAPTGGSSSAPTPWRRSSARCGG